MTDAPAIMFRWEGDGFKPARPHWAKAADKHFVIGEEYMLIEHHDRSGNSHRHYFVSIHEAWKNLPEEQAERFSTSEHLRKWALIKAGYHDSQTLVCASKAEALRVAAFMRPIDEFGIVTVSEATVTRYTAKSQSLRAMGREDFQRSKEAVLVIVSDLIGVSPITLQENAKVAA